MAKQTKNYIEAILDLLSILPKQELKRIYDYLSELYLS